MFDLNRQDMDADWYKEKATDFYEESVANEEISNWDKFVVNKDVVEEELFYDQGADKQQIFWC